MESLTWFLVGLQALLMGIDEGYCHRKRGLPKWERWGHPVDTLFFIFPLSVAAWAPIGMNWLIVYILLSFLSVAMVTKDEWVHAETCTGFEHWLHAWLFILHPCLLFLVGFHWYEGSAMLLRQWLPWMTMGWGFYQFFYWRQGETAD